MGVKLMTNKAGSLQSRPVMNVREAAEKWGVSIRRVSKLCQDGRVDGAYKLSARMWLIPTDAEKPGDCRGLKGNPKAAKKAAGENVRRCRVKASVGSVHTSSSKKGVG